MRRSILLAAGLIAALTLCGVATVLFCRRDLQMA